MVSLGICTIQRFSPKFSTKAQSTKDVCVGFRYSMQADWIRSVLVSTQPLNMPPTLASRTFSGIMPFTSPCHTLPRVSALVVSSSAALLRVLSPGAVELPMRNTKGSGMPLLSEPARAASCAPSSSVRRAR